MTFGHCKKSKKVTDKHLYHPPYRPDIDGLRALAVLPVVVFHASPRFVPGGFTGVDIFFVISGFIISTILLTSLDHGRFSLLEFYERRARRIFPALTLVFAFCLMVGWFTLFSDEYAELGKHVLAGSGFIQNFILLNEIGYFDKASALKPLLHIWSLSIEEQFYLIWPILLIIMWRYRVNFLAVTFVALVVSFALNIYLTDTAPSSAFYLPVSRFWELMIGGIGGYLVKSQSPLLKRVGNILPAIGIMILVAGFVLIREGPHFPGWVALAPTIGAFFVLVGNRGTLVARGLSLPPLVWFGKISYPLYLWHFPLLAFTRIAVDGSFQEPPASWRIAAIVLSAIFAYLTYQFIERPIRYADASKGMFSFSLKARAIGSAVALMIVAGMGGAVYLTAGVPARIQLEPASATELFRPYPHPLSNDNCRNRFPELKGSWSCLLSKPADPDVLLIGDSHANQYYISLAKLLPDRAVMNFSEPSCFPFSTSAVSNPVCEKNLSKLLAFVEKHPSIKTVVLTGYFSYLEGGFKFGNIEGQRVANDVPAPQDRANFMKSADMVLGKYSQMNKHIVLLRDIPDLVFNTRSCVAFNSTLMSTMRGTSNRRSIEQCGVDFAELQTRNRPYENDLTTIIEKYPSVIALDPKPPLCSNGFCNAATEQGFVYWNADHLSVMGADFVLQHFSQELRKATRQ